MTTDPRRPTIAGQLLELRALLKNARWSLLDAMTLVNNIYEQAVRIEQAHMPTLGPEDPEPNHEDYRPSSSEEQ